MLWWCKSTRPVGGSVMAGLHIDPGVLLPPPVTRYEFVTLLVMATLGRSWAKNIDLGRVK